MLSLSFTPPPDGVCPGDTVTFTCEVDMSSAVIRWDINPEGDDRRCSYSIDDPDTDQCGPGRRFESSQTVNGPTNSSSLSVVNITNDLNETTVTCSVAVGDFTESSDICISGDHKVANNKKML